MSTTSSANTALLAKIQEQLEFYFGDANLQKDRYLTQLVNADKEGYVDLEKIANFNKMKLMTTSYEVVVEAVKNSALLQLDSTGKRVKRTRLVPVAKNVDSRTVYVEGFSTTSTTHDTLKELFSVIGKVGYVSIPRNKDQARTFKGFAFIEYETEEDAARAIKELNTIDNPDHNPVAPEGLRVITKDAWDRLKDEYKEIKSTQPRNEHRGTPDHGLILHLSNASTEVPHPEIKGILKNYGKILYLDMGENGEGYARFATPDEAKNAATKITEQKLQIGGKEVSVRIVEAMAWAKANEGEEEQKYWEKILEISEKKKAEMRNNHSEKKGKNSNDNATSKRAAKKQKVSKGDQKEKGRKEPRISVTKPLKHVFFNEDTEPATAQATTPNTEQNTTMEV